VQHLFRHITAIVLLLFCCLQLWAQPFMDLKSVEALPASVNTPSEEGYPLLSPDGRLYFVRSLYDGNKGGKLAGQDIWYTERVGEGWSEPSNELGKLNNRFNNGVVGIADSGNVLYLNSTYSNKHDYQIGLSTAKKVEKGWSIPQRVKMRGFDPRSRFFTFYVDDKNEVMLMSFAKDDETDEDIYISLKKGLTWSPPIPLTSVNTGKAEFAPYLSEDGRVLYFTSDGYPGKGGFDIYMSRRLDDSWNNWSLPVSLPEPINSAKFDAYFTIRGTEAFFSSNRDGEFADLYRAEYEKREREEPEEEDMKQEELFADALEGYVIVPNATSLTDLEVLNAEGEVVDKLRADSSGRFVLKGLEDYSSYFIDLKGEGLDDAEVYLLNKRGDRVYLNRDLLTDKYPFETLEKDVQAVLLADVQDESKMQETWFEIQALEEIVNVPMRLQDADGNLIEEQLMNDEGGFVFEKLKVNEYYTLSMDESVEDSPLFIRQNGELVPLSGNILKGLLFKKVLDGSIVLYQDELLASDDAAKFRFDYAPLDANGARVFLYDENGNILETTVVNEEGLFAFSRLDPNSKYSIGLSDEVDPSKGVLYGYDKYGNEVLLMDYVKLGKQFNGNPAWLEYEDTALTETESFKFDYGDLPPEGSIVYLTDEDDNIIDSAVVDENGEFRFLRLKPDQAYKIKLKNADDMSMGLDRFFVVDAEGEKLGFNQDGTSKGNLVGEELAATTEKFSFDEENLPEPGTVVYLTDENDNVVDSAVVDENGEFRFLRLKPDVPYKIKLADDADKSMGLDRFFVIDAEGQKVAFNEKGESTTNLVGKALAESTDPFKFDYENLPPAGTVVYLTDDFGNVIDSATVDENGGLRYNRLDEEDTYKLKLTEVRDRSEGLNAFAVIDAEGGVLQFNEQGESIGPLIGKDAATNTESFQFDEETRPEAGTVVYLTDENDNVVDSAVVDENGEFRFLRLSPFGVYKIKMDDAVDNSKGLSSFFVFDAAGNKVELGADGESKTRIVGKEEAKLIQYYAFGYDELPPDGTVIYITNASDQIVDSVIVYDGGFRYRRLDADQGDGLQMKYADGTMNLSDAFNLLQGDERKGVKLMNTIDRGNYFERMSRGRFADRYDRFEFEGGVPAVGTKIYIYGDQGTLRDSAQVYSGGRFSVAKLKKQKTYTIKVGEQFFDYAAADLYSLIQEQRRKLWKLPSSYSYRPITIEAEDDTKLDFDRFLIETTEPIAAGSKVYLYEKEVTASVDSSEIAEDGSFQFERLDRNKEYSMKFDDGVAVEGASVYAVNAEGEQQPLPAGDDGFSIEPKALLAEEIENEEESITLTLGSVKDGGEITMKPIETAATEAKKDEIFELTPPVDEKETPVEVPKTVVNETVFEPVEVEEEAQPKQAVAVMDDSDWKQYLGRGEAYETEKGYNLQFGFNEFLLSENQIDYLIHVVIPMLRKNPNMVLTIEGHTDSFGSDDVNQRMAVLRASNVLYHLEMAGIEDTHLNILAKGEHQPLAPNDTPEGRALNRRVELIKDQVNP
jgi:outer membrane protein OmpA-like peptidoglycan-associated protein